MEVMKTPEELETETKTQQTRDRRYFYFGMLAGSVLTFLMILINRF